ncbi:MAG: CDP-diacylglycerol--serine O-phosphatidyltransferase [Pseudohongiellaceae bacterium]|jgi:CDP-diacylglycerol--serine O-phosphatidyltransferase
MSARSLIPVLPTLMTLGNLVCGFMAMAKTVDAMTVSGGLGPLDPAFAAKILQAAHLVLLGMVFDALDGRVARMTNNTSPFGAQLDSLADAVTFGVTPALMAKVVYEHGKIGLEQPFMPKVISALCALYLIGAVLRLARFTANTDADEASHHTFEGLPSPAAAGLIVSAIIFIFDGRSEIGFGPETADSLAVLILRSLPFVAAATGVLMVAKVSYVHVVQRYVGPRTRISHFVNVVVVVACALIFHEWSLFLVSVLYVGGGLILALRSRITGRPVLDALPAPIALEDLDDHADLSDHQQP